MEQRNVNKQTYGILRSYPNFRIFWVIMDQIIKCLETETCLCSDVISIIRNFLTLIWIEKASYTKVHQNEIYFRDFLISGPNHYMCGWDSTQHLYFLENLHDPLSNLEIVPFGHAKHIFLEQNCFIFVFDEGIQEFSLSSGEKINHITWSQMFGQEQLPENLTFTHLGSHHLAVIQKNHDAFSIFHNYALKFTKKLNSSNTFENQSGDLESFVSQTAKKLLPESRNFFLFLKSCNDIIYGLDCEQCEIFLWSQYNGEQVARFNKKGDSLGQFNAPSEMYVYDDMIYILQYDVRKYCQVFSSLGSYLGELKLKKVGPIWNQCLTLSFSENRFYLHLYDHRHHTFVVHEFELQRHHTHTKNSLLQQDLVLVLYEEPERKKFLKRKKN